MIIYGKKHLKNLEEVLQHILLMLVIKWAMYQKNSLIKIMPWKYRNRLILFWELFYSFRGLGWALSIHPTTELSVRWGSGLAAGGTCHSPRRLSIYKNPMKPASGGRFWISPNGCPKIPVFRQLLQHRPGNHGSRSLVACRALPCWVPKCIHRSLSALTLSYLKSTFVRSHVARCREHVVEQICETYDGTNRNLWTHVWVSLRTAVEQF